MHLHKLICYLLSNSLLSAHKSQMFKAINLLFFLFNFEMYKCNVMFFFYVLL